MQTYMAGIEHNNKWVLDHMPDEYIEFGLVSFYYLRNHEHFEHVMKKCKRILVDSGAHSFQHGTKVDFMKFTHEYKEFVAKYTNNPKVVGFFEMDIDNIEGYEKVLEYRQILESVSDKIIPVWHKNRGIADYYQMCQKYANRRVAISGFRNSDIMDSQYNLFFNTAHHYGCDIHLLGMTRFEMMKDLKFKSNDSADSSSWAQTGVFGGINVPKDDKTMYKFTCLEGTKIKAQLLIRVNSLLAVYHQKMLK